MHKISLNFRLKVLFLFLITLFIANSFAGNINVTVGKRNIAVGDSFKITFSTFKTGKFKPNIMAALKDFVIQYRGSLNSKSKFSSTLVKVKRQWFYVVQAKKPGQFVIPSVAFGQYKSPEIMIRVSKARVVAPNRVASNNSKSKHLRIHASIKPGSYYAKQEMLLTVKVYVSRDIDGGLRGISSPKFLQGNAIVKRLHNPSGYQEKIDNIPYTVYERRYVIYPQKAGPLKLKAFSAVVNVRTANSSSDPFNDPFFRDFFGSNQPQFRITRPTWNRAQLRSKEIQLDIKSIPKNASPRNWLPARDVKVIESWLSKSGTIRVGDSIDRTISVSVVGQIAELIPALGLNPVKGLKQYQGNAIFEHRSNPRGIVGTRTEKYALIATKVGEFRLPEIKVNWWNTTTNSFETAIVPERKIKVIASLTGNTSLSSTDSMSSKSFVPRGISSPGSNTLPSANPFWIWFSGFIFILWLLTLAGWWTISRSRKADLVSVDARKKSLKIQKQSSLVREIQRNCKQNHAKQCRANLIAWGQFHWGDNKVANLSDLKSMINRSSFTTKVEELEAVLYAQESDINLWQGEDFWSVFSELSKLDRVHEHNQESSLASMNPR